MSKLLTEYFYYTRSERNGVLTLIVVISTFLALPKIYGLLFAKHELTDFSIFEKEIAAFRLEKPNDTEGGHESLFFNSGSKKTSLFAFDPNTVSQDELIELGLLPRVAKTLVHYREKGGQFRQKTDLKKIYGLTEMDFDRLEPFIAFKGENKYQNLNAVYPFESQSFKRSSSFRETNTSVQLKPFDPNSATYNELLALGLQEQIVNNLLKYREKGGRFKTKEDLRKIYGFSDIDFFRINQFVQIPENQVVQESKNNARTDISAKLIEKIHILPIDLNRASTEDLLQLHGIGHTFAARITELRTRLGGFTSLEQLKEVFGLPDSTIRAITPYLHLTTSDLRKIYVNKAIPTELKHPYLSKRQADAVVRYRLNHGAFKNFDDLKKIGVFDNASFEKLKSYISFE
jgi:DNA uptake protein ComE-like DNA-binding protein